MRLKPIHHTTIKVSFLKLFYVCIISGLKIRKNLILGSIGFNRAYKSFYELYKNKLSLMFSGALSESLIKEWQVDNVGRVTPIVDRKIKQTLIDDEIVKNISLQNTKHKKVAGFLDEFIQKNFDNINDIVHIGARVDTLSAYFSNKFKEITFHSVDLQPNMHEINMQLGTADNWKLYNDYALDLLKKNKIKSDLVIMISTAVKLNHYEFNQYLESFRLNKVKYIIFYEPWWAFPFSFRNFWIKKPENITMSLSPLAGMTADYTHNYIEKLKEHGYSTVISEIRNSVGQKYYNELFIVAADKNL